MRFVMVKPAVPKTPDQKRAKKISARRTEAYVAISTALHHSIEYVGDPANRPALHAALDKALDIAARQGRECAALWPEEHR